MRTKKLRRIPAQKDLPPVKPRDEQGKKITVLTGYLEQLINRGAPESELLAQQKIIDRERENLRLMKD